MVGNLCKKVVPYKVQGAASGSDTVLTTTAVQPAGAGSNILWSVTFGAITLDGTPGTPELRIEVSDNGSDYTELEDENGDTVEVAIAAGMTSKIVLIELVAVRHAYARLIIDRADSSGNSIAVVSATAFVHSSRVQPDPTGGDGYSSKANIDL